MRRGNLRVPCIRVHDKVQVLEWAKRSSQYMVIVNVSRAKGLAQDKVQQLEGRINRRRVSFSFLML